jgi:lipopolysaccharide/colanic/teichoic acid biosynthesis glycosyltransferase
MRIWPVIVDSQPSYLRGRDRGTSLLLAPLGERLVMERLTPAIRTITEAAPLVLANQDSDSRYAEWIHALCPSAQVIFSAEQFATATVTHELSDAWLFVDPRCLPIQPINFSELLRHHAAEPRVSHHFVAFEKANAGTKESVAFDSSGQIRGIQRYYEDRTWSFIAGTSASLVPCASGLAAGGVLPRTMRELRQFLSDRGVPIRDIPIAGGALNLDEEGGILAANEQFIIETPSPRRESLMSTRCIGEGQTIHPTARMMGPIVVHADAKIEANATVLGPVVIGPGARIASGAVVAHATIGADSVVPPNVTVRDHAWFRNSGDAGFGVTERPPMSYNERLARLSQNDRENRLSQQPDEQAKEASGLGLKRALDIVVASIGLSFLSPLLAIMAAAVRLESRGPIFYGDKREGVGGEVFKCWKFRTMFTGAHLAQMQLKALDQTDGPHFKVDRDPRVTRVGQVLRALNLDEVPQLFNVLLGQMSLVGPRPSPFRENQVCVPWRAARLSVRPGITGFWQVCRHNRAAGDFHQWIEYDLLYVQNQSFWLDLKILAATLLTLGGKLRHVPASWLVRPSAVEAAEHESELMSASVTAAAVQPHNPAERVA